MTGSESDSAGVRVPPPLVYGGALLLGAALAYLQPLAIFGAAVATPARLGLGAALALLGLALGIFGFLTLRKAGTNVPAHLPTTALVTAGPYRYSRNPLYVSLTLVYGGIALAADNLWMLLLLVAVLIHIRYAVIAREEAYLERKFGDDYRRFKMRVRRWI